MKKVSMVMLLILLSVVLISGSAYAISGVCSNCHTMHNSQNGTCEVRTYSGGVITTQVCTPQGYLLRADCIACHSGSTGKTNAGAPIVVHTTCPSTQGGSSTLAGGDFCYVATGIGTPSDSKGHNVSGLVGSDGTITPANTPPGWDPAATVGFTFGQVAGGLAWGANQLTCAGKYGCHGNHTEISSFSAIQRSHHSNPGLTATVANTADTIGNSYRFLAGIKGLEETNWNYGETTSTHNEYYGVDSANSRQWETPEAGTYDVAVKSTISFLCAECHGFFHSNIASTGTGASPWLRHPTDIVLPNTDGKEYSKYNPDTDTTPRTYSLEAPVARGSVKTSSGLQVTPGLATGDNSAIVMCLSCHRAHGSPEPDLLRWTYSGMQAGSGTTDSGCFTCHTCKNADCP